VRNRLSSSEIAYKEFKLQQDRRVRPLRPGSEIAYKEFKLMPPYRSIG